MPPDATVQADGNVSEVGVGVLRAAVIVSPGVNPVPESVIAAPKVPSLGENVTVGVGAGAMASAMMPQFSAVVHVAVTTMAPAVGWR